MLARVFLPVPGGERSEDVERRQHKASAGSGSKTPDIAIKALYSLDYLASVTRDITGPARKLRALSHGGLGGETSRNHLPVKHTGVY
jgi:hypothetical protein